MFCVRLFRHTENFLEDADYFCGDLRDSAVSRAAQLLCMLRQSQVSCEPLCLLIALH